MAEISPTWLTFIAYKMFWAPPSKMLMLIPSFIIRWYWNLLTVQLFHLVSWACVLFWLAQIHLHGFNDILSNNSNEHDLSGDEESKTMLISEKQLNVYAVTLPTPNNLEAVLLSQSQAQPRVTLLLSGGTFGKLLYLLQKQMHPKIFI